YFGSPNGGYSGPVTINAGTAARLLTVGRTGTGGITINGGGELAILSDAAAGEMVTNMISVSSGTIRADHNFTMMPTPAFAPGILHILGPGPGVPLVLDNPTSIGGTNAASVTFTSNNGYNIQVYGLMLGNAQAPPAAAGT